MKTDICVFVNEPKGLDVILTSCRLIKPAVIAKL